MYEASGAIDQLQGSPVLAECLGDALPSLQVFHDKLAAEGELRGIIGPRDISIIWERHILNSAAIVPFLRDEFADAKSCRVADVGSGGGFPGIVAAACLPEEQFTLIEPMERRIEWLHECISEMGLKNVQVIRQRSEDLIADMSKYTSKTRPFDVVTCRAVAPMTKLVPWTLPLLVAGGKLIALKGRSAQAEIDKASKVISKYHGCQAHVLDAPVGPGLEPTHVVVVDKAK
ncbi:16S rRNA (guanine(527)-N(7))-methyltransferase RsmG [Bifidobacterium aemilianum]|uniref:Ribosomal RNA small subunit methyltransferase G n=1 Tax=Bifidobacterium aemilianum TaxID=2493120 RepID=A0A366K931_9BIFI|nr:16S rRNA (guanine(527)-N(7))-methyltransferase RsmG [Bifidobacterium aemilianum]RBP97752.1 16S rRNA (guanine(527)-N(7))-methyltransferase RsmG [Bifidobacterium aemilianum]